MATDKKFTVAGASTLSGVTKIRFANDTMRIKILSKNGHEDIELIELPVEMTKAEIIQHMKDTGFGIGNPQVQTAMSLIVKRNPVKHTATTAVNSPVHA
jgi:hypothetical protein